MSFWDMPVVEYIPCAGSGKFMSPIRWLSSRVHPLRGERKGSAHCRLIAGWRTSPARGVKKTRVVLHIVTIRISPARGVETKTGRRLANASGYIPCAGSGKCARPSPHAKPYIPCAGSGKLTSTAPELVGLRISPARGVKRHPVESIPLRIGISPVQGMEKVTT
jgi:hypothetical protein